MKNRRVIAVAIASFLLGLIVGCVSGYDRGAREQARALDLMRWRPNTNNAVPAEVGP